MIWLKDHVLYKHKQGHSFCLCPPAGDIKLKAGDLAQGQRYPFPERVWPHAKAIPSLGLYNPIWKMRWDFWGPFQLWQPLIIPEQEWDRLASLPGKERNSPLYFVSQAENRAVSMSNPTEAAWSWVQGQARASFRIQAKPPPSQGRCEILQTTMCMGGRGVGLGLRGHPRPDCAFC